MAKVLAPGLECNNRKLAPIHFGNNHVAEAMWCESSATHMLECCFDDLPCLGCIRPVLSGQSGVDEALLAIVGGKVFGNRGS